MNFSLLSCTSPKVKNFTASYSEKTSLSVSRHLARAFLPPLALSNGMEWKGIESNQIRSNQVKSSQIKSNVFI